MGSSRIRVVVVGLVLASACGTESPDVASGPPPSEATATTSSGTSAATATAAPPATVADRSASILPAVSLTHVQAGSFVDLATLIPAKEPVLLWFWAPH